MQQYRGLKTFTSLALRFQDFQRSQSLITNTADLLKIDEIGIAKIFLANSF